MSLVTLTVDAICWQVAAVAVAFHSVIPKGRLEAMGEHGGGHELFPPLQSQQGLVGAEHVTEIILWNLLNYSGVSVGPLHFLSSIFIHFL